jgi:hypothetical protein
MKISKPRDRFGKVVAVGDHVRVVKVTQNTLEGLPLDEQERVRSMVGEVFEIQEIDRWGYPWVEKWWDDGAGYKNSHSLSLDSDEMERVDIVAQPPRQKCKRQ